MNSAYGVSFLGPGAELIRDFLGGGVRCPHFFAAPIYAWRAKMSVPVTNKPLCALAELKKIGSKLFEILRFK